MLDSQTIAYLASLAVLFGASVYLRDRRAFLFVVVILSQWCETTGWCIATDGTDVPWWFNFTVNITAGWLTALYIVPPDRRSVIWSGSFVLLAAFDVAGSMIAPARYWDGLWFLSWAQLVLIGTGVAYEGIVNHRRNNGSVSANRVFSWRMVRRKHTDR